MSVLAKILEAKRARLAAARTRTPLAELRSRARDLAPTRDFAGAIRRPRGAGGKPEGGIRLIAECKKASPSRGLIRPDFDPAAIARIYASRAQAVSVITEEDFFQGELGFLRIVADSCGLPVLRKDFIVDAYQIYESRVAGADALLLIGRAFEGGEAGDLLGLTAELGMAALYEVHDRRDLERALGAGASVIGINNRDLRSLSIDLGTTFGLLTHIPGDRTVVSESGIAGRRDVLALEAAGADAVLVGTHFMRATDVGASVDELMGQAGRAGQAG